MVNGFTKKRVGTLTLGERLKKLRSDKRMSMAEVSRATRIQQNYLESLEDGQYDRLPPEVYIKGFLRSYAELLGVDESILVKLYEKEREIKKNLEKSKEPVAFKTRIEPINISSFVFTPKRMLVALAVILIIVGVGYLYREIGAFSSTPRLIVFSPQANAEVEGNNILVEGVTDKDAKLFINGQPILVSDEGKFREKLTLQSGVNVINVKSINKFQKEVEETLTVQSKYGEQIAGEMISRELEELGGSGEEKNGEFALNTEEIQMELRVDPGPVWLNVEADGSVVFSGTMMTGAIQIFRAKEKVVISSGRADATYAKFNGKNIGTLGPDPKPVKDVTFTKDTQY